MLCWRIGLGAVLVLLVAGIFVIDGFFRSYPPGGFLGLLLHDGLVIAIMAAILCGAGAYELYRLARSGGYHPCGPLMVVGAALLPLHVVLGCYLPQFCPLRPEIIGLFLILAFLVQLYRKTTQGAVGNIAVTLFAIVYLGLLGSYAVEIRSFFGVTPFVMLLVVAKCGDIAAYFTGVAFGRTRLIPWLSPGKTVEGLAGALVVTAGITVAITRAVDVIKVGILGAAAVGVFLGLCGHFGDLVESLIKRDCAAKDSAKLLPQFGGVLDLIDSVLPTALLWYIILSILGK